MTRPTRARRFIRRRTFRTLGNQLQLAGLGFGVATGVAWPATGELEPFLAGGALVFTCLGLGLERVEVPVSLSAWLRAWWSGVDEDLVDSKEDTLDALSEGQKAVMNAQRKRLQELHDELLAWERTTIDWSALQKDALRSLRGAVTALMPPVAPPPSSDGYSPGWLTADMVMKVRRAVRKSACLPSSELLERVYHELHFVHGGRQTGSASWAYELTIGHLDRVYNLVTHERRQATHERRQATEREAQQQATRDRLVALLDRATSTTHKGFQTLQASVGHLIDRNLQLAEDKRRLEEERAFDRPLGEPGLRRITVSDRFVVVSTLPNAFFVDVTLVRTSSIQGVYLVLLEKNVEQVDDLPIAACITSARVVNGPEPLELIEHASSPVPVDRCTTHPEHAPLHLKSPLLPAGTRLRLTFEHQGVQHAGVALTVTPVVLLHEPPGDALVEDLLEVHQLPVFFDVKALVEKEQQADLEEGGLDGYSRESAKGFAEALDRARERGMPEDVLARFPLELSRPVKDDRLTWPSVWAYSLVPGARRMLGSRIQLVIRSQTKQVGSTVFSDPADNLITAICLPGPAGGVQWVLGSQWASVDLLEDFESARFLEPLRPTVFRVRVEAMGRTLWRPLGNVRGLEALGETVDWTQFSPGADKLPTETGTLVVLEDPAAPFHARAFPNPLVLPHLRPRQRLVILGWFPKPVVEGEPLLAIAIVECAGKTDDGAPCKAEPTMLVEGRPYCEKHGLELVAEHKRGGTALHVELLPPSLPPDPLDTVLLTQVLDEHVDVTGISVAGRADDLYHPDLTYQVVHCAGHDKSCERAPVVLVGDVPWCEACLPYGDSLVEELPLRRGLTWITGRSRPLVEGDALLEQLGPCAICGAEAVGEAVCDTGGWRTEPRCQTHMPWPSVPMPSELREALALGEELLEGLGPCTVCGAKASGETLLTDTGRPEPRCAAHFPGQLGETLLDAVRRRKRQRLEKRATHTAGALGAFEEE